MTYLRLFLVETPSLSIKEIASPLIFVKKIMDQLKNVIENAWEDRSQLENRVTQTAIREVVDMLDRGTLRVAEPTENGWIVNEWIKKAVVLYFPIQKMETIECGPF